MKRDVPDRAKNWREKTMFQKLSRFYRCSLLPPEAFSSNGRGQMVSFLQKS